MNLLFEHGTFKLYIGRFMEGDWVALGNPANKAACCINRTVR